MGATSKLGSSSDEANTLRQLLDSPDAWNKDKKGRWEAFSNKGWDVWEIRRLACVWVVELG